MKKLNFIAPAVLCIICFGATIYFAIVRVTELALCLGAAAGIFAVACVFFFFRYKNYVNPTNLLLLLEKNPAKIKQRIKRNLIKNGFALRDGFYVNTENKAFDVYFSTFDAENINRVAEAVSLSINCDSQFLQRSLQVAGFISVEGRYEGILDYLSSTARQYEDPRLFNNKKRSVVILVDVASNYKETRRMYYLGLVPFHKDFRYDAVSMIEFDTANGEARLPTQLETNDPQSRSVIRSIFKDVIDFDN